MLGIKQGSPYDHHQFKVFRGVRFMLFGFDTLNKANVLKKLIDGGAVDAGQFGPSCTHVIVHRLVYDDPVCIAARGNGKILVTGLWVEHSFDVGIPLDISSIMYRPLRDLNGIPGAKSLVICLTGYQRQDREDIMTMVGLMGANFSKPLIAHKVTHLICYKFEGEKYELAKKMKTIKLVNHLWLEACGYELEMMEAVVKDSEEEREGVDTKQHPGKAAIIQHPFMKEETFQEPLDCFAPKDFGPFGNSKGISAVMEKSTNAQVPNLLETQSKQLEKLDSGEPSNPSAVMEKSTNAQVPNLLETQSKQLEKLGSGEPSNPYNPTAIHATSENEWASTSKDERTPKSDAVKLVTKCYSRKRTTPSMNSGKDAGTLNSSIERGKHNLGNDFELTSTPMQLENFKIDDKGSPLGSKEKQSGTLSQKRKTEVRSGCSKLQKIGANTKAHIPEHTVLACRTEGVGLDFSGDISTHPSPCKSNRSADLDIVRKSSSLSATNYSSSTWKSVKQSSPISKTIASEIMKDENKKAVQIYSKGSKGAALSYKPENRNLDMSTPQTTIVEDQNRPNEAQDISMESHCTEKMDIKKSSTNTESVGDGVSRSEHLAVEDIELHNVMQDILIPCDNTKISDIEKSPHSGNLELQTGGALESDSKPLGRKKVSKKLLGPKRSLGKGKSTNQTGSVLLKKTAPMNDSLTLEKAEMVAAVVIPDIEIVMEKTDGHFGKLAESISVCDDDETETEPPEDKEAPDEEKCDKVEGDNIAGNMVNDEGQLRGRIELISAACGKKSQLKDSIQMENQVMEKITKRKRHSLNKSKKTSVPSVLCVSTEKALLVDDETKSLEKTEEAVGEGKCVEAEPNNTTGSEAKDEGKKNQSRELTKTENPVQEKITKEKKVCLRKSKTVPSVLCVTTEQEARKDEFASEGKNENKRTKKDVVPSSTSKTKRALAKSKSKNTRKVEKENQPIHIGDEQNRKKACKVSNNTRKTDKSALDLLPKECVAQTEPVCFILSGDRLQRKEFQQVIKRLKGRVCRDSHHWSYEATHFIAPDPIRRTEKFFAAAASGRWILKTAFLTDSNQAGTFLSEEPYEWHKNSLSEDSMINLEAPRKWRLLKEKTGHGAFYGMHIIIYGECIAPRLDTLKRVVKAGDGTILATSPPYTRSLESRIDFAIVSPSMPLEDVWVQEFLRHEIPCIAADYLVEYVCKPGSSLDRHVHCTHEWAEKSLNNLNNRLQLIAEPSTPRCHNNDVVCQVCGSRGGGDFMLVCGGGSGSTKCGVGTHIDCCDPPLKGVPREDWYCTMCSKISSSNTPLKKTKKKALASKRK